MREGQTSRGRYEVQFEYLFEIFAERSLEMSSHVKHIDI